MKQIILTISSILTLSSLAQARLCTPDILQGNWRTQQVIVMKAKTCGDAKIISTTQLFIANNDGQVNGYGDATTVTKYPNGSPCAAKPMPPITIPKVTFDKRLNIYWGGDAEVFTCSMTEDGSTMTLTSFGGTSEPATYTRDPNGSKPGNTAKSGNDANTQHSKDLGDWAPKQEVKQYKAAPVAVQSQKSNSALGDWAPVAQ